MGRIVFTSIIVAITALIFIVVPVYVCSRNWKEKAKKKKPLMSNSEQRRLEHELLGDLYPNDGSMHDKSCGTCLTERNRLHPPQKKEIMTQDYFSRIYESMTTAFAEYDRQYRVPGNYTYSTSQHLLAQQREARYRKYKELYGKATAQHLVENDLHIVKKEEK